ncbi:MAG: hypothetical protein LJE97_07925 [Betaproteobacteria bacterium]|jgi:pyruvate/2-oxoglutarate dehydrogenase complex dihydrolipoamide acyltransferase (E2) component|nr:hypothetical protein [Betaproteobacteria bacterium]
MEKNAVLVKTAKGTEEVKSRAHGLAARLRSVLIMVDGKSTVADYIARFGAIPDIDGTLQMLLAQGFLEARVATVAPPPPPPAAAPPPAPQAAAPQAPGTPEPLPETRKEAVGELSRVLLDSMGPDADMFTGIIERARTRVEFTEAAERCARVLDSLGARGKAKAAWFRERMQLVAERFFDA